MTKLIELYNKLKPLKADGLREGYRKILEHDGYVLAMGKMQEGFEFVTWSYTYDGSSVTLVIILQVLNLQKKILLNEQGLLMPIECLAKQI